MWQMTYVTQSQWKLPEYTWDKERKTCEQCKHYRERMSGTAYHQTIVMSCRINNSGTLGRQHGTCIAMRYEGECGREAKLFEPK